MKKRSERRKHCARAGCSKIRTPPARCHTPTDRTDYNTLRRSQLARSVIMHFRAIFARHLSPNFLPVMRIFHTLNWGRVGLHYVDFQINYWENMFPRPPPPRFGAYAPPHSLSPWIRHCPLWTETHSGPRCRCEENTKQSQQRRHV